MRSAQLLDQSDKALSSLRRLQSMAERLGWVMLTIAVLDAISDIEDAIAEERDARGHR